MARPRETPSPDTALVPRFREQCRCLAAQLEEAQANLWDALSHHWLYIQERSFAFDSRRQQAARVNSPLDFAEVNFLKSCSLQQLQAFVREAISSRS